MRPPRLLLAVVAACLLAGTTVATADEPRPGLTVSSLVAGRDSSGSPYVLAHVVNTSGRALDLTGTLRLKDGPGGVSAGPFAARLGTRLGVGQSGPVLVRLDKAVPAGSWFATLQLASGKVRSKVEGTITFPVRVASQSPPVVPTVVPVTDSHPVVVAVAITLIAVMSLALLWLELRRRRSDKGPAQ